MVRPDLAVYAQASKGFLAPGVAAYYTVNPDANTIAPQETTNYQIGAVYKTTDFTAAIAAYRLTASNFPVSTTVNGLTFLQNAGTARYQGLEAEGTYKIVNGLAAYASASLINAKFVEGANIGARVGGAPAYTIAGGLIYDDQTLFGSVLHKITGDAYGASGQVAGNEFNKIGSYNTTDIVAGVRTDALRKMGFGEKAEFKLGVSNIFDHRNVTDIGGNPASVTAANFATQTTLTYAFQPGRTFYAAMKLDF